MPPHWIWQQPDWPNFLWQAERLAPLLRECIQTQGKLTGMAASVGQSLSAQSELDALLQNIVTSSAIEGEQLNVGSVRSSLARRLGLEQVDSNRVSQRSEGLAQLMLDATRINRLLDGGSQGFTEGISAAQYQAVAKVSKATATRHLAELLEKGCLFRLPGGGRSTRYAVRYPG